MRTTMLSLLAAAAGASAASGQFLETATVLQTFTSDQNPSFFGWAIAEIADLDGDGALDVIVGERDWFADPGDMFPVGRVSVYSGATGAVIHRVSPAAGGRLGFAVADAGDVDGDGVNDFIGGAPFRGGFVGGAEVYSGATGANILSIPAPNGGAFGSAVASAGDLNGDGLGDVMVGAPSEATVGQLGGRVYVVSGADGAVLREYAPGGGRAEFGAGVADAGDLNGDGIPEHFVGAPRSGMAFLYDGATGDLLHAFEAPEGAGRFGEFFVDGLRDVDGDGVRDLYVGDYAFDADPGTPGLPGAAFVYSGATYELLRRFDGPTATSGLGPGRGAGDVDGDGLEDLVLGHYSSSEGAGQGGRVSVHSGASGLELRRLTGTVAGEQLGFDAVGVGDVDGDGRADLALSSANGNVVRLVAGETPCTGDLTGDRSVGSEDLAALIGAWGAGGGDVTGDGVTGASDLAALLGAWGDCD